MLLLLVRHGQLPSGCFYFGGGVAVAVVPGYILHFLSDRFLRARPPEATHVNGQCFFNNFLRTSFQI